MAWITTVLFLAFCAAASLMSAVRAADPDPLQDFCVADLSADATLVNGFPCKPRSTVTAEDFVFRGLRNARKSPCYLSAVRSIAERT